MPKMPKMPKIKEFCLFLSGRAGHRTGLFL
jgi:hypothetical protein